MEERLSQSGRGASDVPIDDMRQDVQFDGFAAFDLRLAGSFA
jgi:hypothetical protein